IPFIQSRASMPVMLSSLGAIILGYLIVATPIREVFDFVKLPANYWPRFFGIIIAYMLTVEVAKRLYIKISKEWI
ncbi:cation transporting ATPase C-terminal domain-containing protein, partial [Enterococcus faecalis]|uniref:cation transporting ATPase C-terminal domain-containing protein n=1 Tax=Enterococcus faecalis TaxID=1351 RepID=UPI003CC66E0C